MRTHADHVREIEAVALGRSTLRDPVVIQSWRRCLEQHRLDPARACDAIIVPEERLKEHRQQSEQLVSIARSGLERLYNQVAGQGYVLLLADHAGVTVDFMGDALWDGDLRKAGLYLGSEWAEARSGTSAIGSCIATGEALSIHQGDHFDATHIPLSCTAAPIYDTQGHLAAVLDLSLLTSPVPKASQNLALHLVSAAARRIEMANLMARTRHQWVLRFARSPDFLDVDPEGAIAIDDNGCIAGMTHFGSRLLSRSIGADWRDRSALIGRPVSDFAQFGLDLLPQLTRQRSSQDRLVQMRDGNTLFAHAIEPKSAPVRSPVRHRPSIRQLGGKSPEIDALTHKAAKLAGTVLPVLIQGETGTGKEHLARAIHDGSGRKGAFVAINCAAIPESLIESELFGHAPGAFTGAVAKGRKGLIEQADGGTLFLDEIGDMPLMLQSRLLRVLAEKEVQPVGAVAPRAVDLRVISASHRPLADLMRDGLFREDLFYRLSAATLHIPPLRDRGDFGWLLDRLLQRHAAGQPMVVTHAAMALLRGHSWPGNVRELDNVLAVAAALTETGRIDCADLPDAIAGGVTRPDDEAGALNQLLSACNWNVSEAARRLGVDRTTIHRRIRRLGIVPHS